MSKAIPALVTPELLVWARNLDSISVGEIAAKMHTTSERILEWENGTAHPTLTQAKNLAKQYRVPFVYFYLPDIPQKTKRLDKVDYRTFGNVGDQFVMSRELRWLLRDIEDRRDTMLTLYADEGQDVKKFPIKLATSTDESQIADAIRQLLGLTVDIQRTFRKPETALNYCIRKLESYDVLIFQAAKVQQAEMRGLSVAYEKMPIIVLNRKDEPSARLFTLFHELVHIITRTSGVCNETTQSANTNNNVELACNRIAGNALVPKSAIKKHAKLEELRTYGFDDFYINAIARDFAVSKEVIIHVLWELNIITKDFYFETLRRYKDEYDAHVAKRPKGFLPPVTDTGTQVGKLYARTVLGAYHADRISARDTSNFLLDLKAKNFSKLERWCF